MKLLLRPVDTLYRVFRGLNWDDLQYDARRKPFSREQRMEKGGYCMGIRCYRGPR
jgi:hypothetical protein